MLTVCAASRAGTAASVTHLRLLALSRGAAVPRACESQVGLLRDVELAAVLAELLGLLFHAALLLERVLAHVLRQLHGAEVRSAHAAEVRALGGLVGQRLVVELARGLGIEREVELVFPAEVEARLAQRVV